MLWLSKRKNFYESAEGRRLSRQAPSAETASREQPLCWRGAAGTEPLSQRTCHEARALGHAGVCGKDTAPRANGQHGKLLSVLQTPGAVVVTARAGGAQAEPPGQHRSPLSVTHTTGQLNSYLHCLFQL